MSTRMSTPLEPCSRPRRRWLAASVGSVLCLAGVTAAQAASPAFPIANKPIRVVVAFPPGAGPDAMARIMLPVLAQELGAPVVIDNRPGAGTLIAAQEVMKAEPDGHTLFFSASSTFAQAPHTLKAATYDPLTAFTPISLGARGPLVVIVNEALGVRDLPALIAYGKANPGKLSYGSFGMGTSSHIYGQVFIKNTGLAMEHIPYKGGADMFADLTEGRLPFAFDAAPQAIQTAKTGRARIIAVAARERSPYLPGVPTAAEQGVKDLDLTSFLGWFGPPGMAPDTVARLNAAIVKAHAAPATLTHFQEAAYTSETSTPEALREEVRKAYADWGRLVDIAGIEKQ